MSLFPEGTTSLATDSEQRSLQKIVELIDGGAIGGGGGGAGLTMYQGGDLDPNGIVTGSVGDMYHSKTTLGGDGSNWVKISGTATTTVWE